MENLNTFILDINDNPFTESFKNSINTDIDYIFPLLNIYEKNLIKKMMMSLLTLIYFKFHFESELQFFNQLSNNNNQDIRMILFLLFPYIEDDNNFQIHKSITNLKDLSISKSKDVYLTNIQYDRYFNISDTKYEYEYNIIDVYNNYLASYYTINKCAHHLYCNWDQIIPLTLTNYSESYIYKDTINTIQKQQIPNNTSLKGLDIRDYYHSFMNDMYIDILPYKWLLYEKYNNDLSKDIMYLEEIINYFNDDNESIFNKTDLEELNDYKKNIFISKWSGFVSLDSYDIIYNILLHFNIKSREYLSDELYDQIQNDLKEFNINIVYDLDDNNVNINKLSKDEMKVLLLNNYNKVEHIGSIYEFLCELFDKFSYTWYGKMIFPQKKFGKKDIVYLKDIEFNKNKIFNTPVYGNSYISYKNIYNFTKSLVFLDNNRITDWDALIPENKQKILSRLNSGSSDWFSISNNLRIKYGNVNTLLIRNKIYDVLSNNITDLVFHSLVSRGILNEFKVKHKKEDIHKSFDGYYYLTQQKYSELLPYYKTSKDRERSSFTKTVLTQRQLFALNWIQQIHFFKHFFHQRVIYVTGGTGTGKSTQVPKLLLYGLLLLGNYSSKVINTQPRINATTGNAKRISEELGVPLMTYNPALKKEARNLNYFVQYSTGKSGDDSKHDQNYGEAAPKLSSYLKIVTDGTLLEIVKKSPFLLGTYKSNNQILETNQNLFDVISIDEAHEHNANMDLLMTFLRDTVQLNNSLRLVIITATIKADEPIYRRYYKYINDNLLYPLNNTLFTERVPGNYYNRQILKEINETFPYINLIEDTRFDRISIDRRLHISAPLSTTIYEIKEYYESSDILTYKDAEPLAIQKAVELTKTANGDILLFSITEPAINKIVTELNNNPSINSKWIALPYYAKVSATWKKIIEDINDILIKDIDVDKRDILLAATSAGKDKEYRKVPKNTYERVIIVCTNVAEASITINTLKFVIDTGFVNTVSFDPVLKVSKNGPEYITETSRIQRKGRVGRVASGTVYYMYKKDARLNSTINYNITQQINQLVYTLINFIKEDAQEQLILKDTTSESFNNLYNEDIKIQYKNNPTTPDFYSNMFGGNTLLRNKMLDPINNAYSYKYKSGYDYINIIDLTGEFYIIHPLENRYVRDKLTGKFINPDIKTIKLFLQFFSDLFKLRLIISDDEKFDLIKTKLYNILDELIQNISPIISREEMNYNKLWSLILGSRYNLLDEVIWINTILDNSTIENLSMKITTKKGYQISNNTLLMKHFGDTTSDLNVYINIFKKLRLVLPRLVMMDSENVIDEYNKYRYKENTRLSSESISIIENFENNNKDKRRLLYIYENENSIDENRIKLCCDQYGLDYDVVTNLLKIYRKNHTAVNIINAWVQKYINYVPYFDNHRSINFIYISSYVNYATSNIDDQSDYNIAIKDPFSIVSGKKIDAISKEIKNNKVMIKHLISYNEIIDLPAIIPALIYPLENDKFSWKDKYILYQNITPDMIEKYILPETENNRADNRRNKGYNTQLLNLFRLIREKLKN